MEGIRNIGFDNRSIKRGISMTLSEPSLIESLEREEKIWSDRIFVLESELTQARHRLNESSKRLEQVKLWLWIPVD